MAQHAEALGFHAVHVSEPFAVCSSPTSLRGSGRVDDPRAVHDEIAALDAVGATDCTVGVHAPTRREWLARAEHLAALVTP